MKKLLTLLSTSFSIALLMSSSAVLAAPGSLSRMAAAKHHVAARLHTVNNSGVEGFVDLRQLKQGGAGISLLAFGLKPGHNYVSLYYGNHACALEPYSAEDVIGGIYTANRVGV